jgi:hypothetical protein
VRRARLARDQEVVFGLSGAFEVVVPPQPTTPVIMQAANTSTAINFFTG